MPVTPFHGGVGLLARGCLGGRSSFLSFCATQVVIDLESGYYLLRDEWPFHRFLHTAPGALVACSLVALLMAFVGSRLGRAAPAQRTLAILARADLAQAASWPAALLTIVTGVLGHLVPDAVMHPDVQPFWPLSEANPLHGLVSLEALHGFLVAIGLLGGVLVVRSALRGTGPGGHRP